MNTIVIGIAGGTGSGKSTIVNRIRRAIGDDIVILAHDYYYKSNDHLSFAERAALNFDHPASLDTAMMIADIRALKRGETVEAPIYDFVQYIRKADKLTLKPKRVIIVEGILIFENSELVDEMDIKIFVDTDADVRIIRRIMRDVEERGRSLQSVVDQYLSTVKPMHEQFVEPTKRKADIIIPEGGHNDVALGILVDRIKSLMGA